MDEDLELQQGKIENGQLGFISRISKMFISPYEVINDISTSPKVLMPLIYSSIVMIITYFIRLPLKEISTNKLSQVYLEKYGIEIPQVAQTSDVMNVIPAFFSPISLILLWVVGGLFLWLVVKIFGGKSKIIEILSLYAHVLMISMTGALIAAPIGVLLHTDISVFSLGVFMPDGDITTFTYNFLSTFEIFTVWSMVIAGIGISILNQFSKAKGIMISLIYLVLGNAFSAACAILIFMSLNSIYK